MLKLAVISASGKYFEQNCSRFAYQVVFIDESLRVHGTSLYICMCVDISVIVIIYPRSMQHRLCCMMLGCCCKGVAQEQLTHVASFLGNN